MNMFYDSKTKKTKSWVYAAFVILPVVLIILSWIFGQQAAEYRKANQKEEVVVDIFEKINE